jgi:hypothetical protein
METRVRRVFADQTVADQADFFQVDNYTRVTGLTISAVSVIVFWQNIVQPWPLVPGALVTDAQVTAGYIYFNEVVGTPGYYSIRWRPNGIGYWRVITNYPGGEQLSGTDYDVIPPLPVGATGLTASFLAPHC